MQEKVSVYYDYSSNLLVFSMSYWLNKLLNLSITYLVDSRVILNQILNVNTQFKLNKYKLMNLL